ncbi:MAG: hypothetical protein ACYDEP_12045 [Acidimicrobiales bacterium]
MKEPFEVPQPERLQRAVETVRRKQPALEKQLADYRERRRDYERLRSSAPSTPTVAPTGVNGYRVY